MVYNLLVQIRKLSKAVKIIIFVALLLLSGLLRIPTVAFVAFLILEHKSYDTNPEKFEKEILEFQRDYDKLRRWIGETVGNEIHIGNYVREYGGKLHLVSSRFSMYTKNLPEYIVRVYPNMEKQITKDGIYYHFPLKKRYSKTAKITIINSVFEYISEAYPDDRLFFNKSAPLGVSSVGLNKIIDTLGIE